MIFPNQQPRVYVSTLYCGEEDYERSWNSVWSQKGICLVGHDEIKDLPELEAHSKQIELWNANKATCDLFVKVDADTVLAHDNVIAVVFDQIMKQNASAAQVYLHDFFTNDNINGLNFYRPETVFSMPTDKLYCDRSVTHRKIIYSDSMPDSVVPAGLHCHNSNLKQAFRYGLHRGHKNQQHVMKKVIDANSRSYDVRRWMAIQGFIDSQHMTVYDYHDNGFEDAYQRALVMCAPVIEVNNK